jgi:hypothetical protein
MQFDQFTIALLMLRPDAPVLDRSGGGRDLRPHPLSAFNGGIGDLSGDR